MQRLVKLDRRGRIVVSARKNYMDFRNAGNVDRYLILVIRPVVAQHRVAVVRLDGNLVFLLAEIVARLNIPHSRSVERHTAGNHVELKPTGVYRLVQVPHRLEILRPAEAVHAEIAKTSIKFFNRLYIYRRCMGKGG